MAYFPAGFSARGDGRTGAILRGLFVHGCGPRGDDERGEPGMVPRFASGDEASDCGGRGNFVAEGNSGAGKTGHGRGCRNGVVQKSRALIVAKSCGTIRTIPLAVRYL